MLFVWFPQILESCGFFKFFKVWRVVEEKRDPC